MATQKDRIEGVERMNSSYKCATCSIVNQVTITAAAFECTNCQTLDNTMSPEVRKARRTALVVVGGGILVLAVALSACSDSGSKGGGDNAALDQRTCQIARDIAGSYNVTDNLEESRSR